MRPISKPRMVRATTFTPPPARLLVAAVVGPGPGAARLFLPLQLALALALTLLLALALLLLHAVDLRLLHARIDVGADRLAELFQLVLEEVVGAGHHLVSDLDAALRLEALRQLADRVRRHHAILVAVDHQARG